MTRICAFWTYSLFSLVSSDAAPLSFGSIQFLCVSWRNLAWVSRWSWSTGAALEVFVMAAFLMDIPSWWTLKVFCRRFDTHIKRGWSDSDTCNSWIQHDWDQTFRIWLWIYGGVSCMEHEALVSDGLLLSNSTWKPVLQTSFISELVMCYWHVIFQNLKTWNFHAVRGVVP